MEKHWVLSQSGVFKVSLTFPPHKEVFPEAPEEDLCPGLQIRKPGNEVAWAKNVSI